MAGDYYFIRDGYSWGHFYVNPEQLLLMIHADTGNYSYQWTNIGPGRFGEFLRGLHIDYFMEKCSTQQHRVFDLAESLEALKLRVMEERKERAISYQFAREAWAEILSIENNDYTDENEFDSLLASSPALMVLYSGEYYDCAKKRINSLHLSFWKELWPLFLKRMSGQ